MRGQCLLNRDSNEVDELRCHKPSYPGANKDSDERVDDAFAQLDEMLEERHLTAGFQVRNRRTIRAGFKLAVAGHGREVYQFPGRMTLLWQRRVRLRLAPRLLIQGAIRGKLIRSREKLSARSVRPIPAEFAAPRILREVPPAAPERKPPPGRLSS